MKFIYTGQNRSDAKRKLAVMVSDEDYDFLSKFNWQVDKNNTVSTHTLINGQRQIHRILLNPRKGEEIDHIDGNRLNNQRSNLRLATSTQNKRNRGPRKDNTSGYKGVCWHKQRQKWAANIHDGNKYHSLGLHANKIDAAKAYNKAALEYHGEFAWINKL